MISNVLNLVDPKPPSAKRNINLGIAYRIAGNFRGRKLSRIGENMIFAEKLSRIAHFCHAEGRHVPNFAEKTFACSHKTAKFAKVFSLECFPLYGT